MVLIGEFNLSEDTPLAHMFAYKGGGKGGKGSKPKVTQAQKDAEAAQQKELADLQAKEDARAAAMKRKRRGRRSLISGAETGQEDGLAKNLGA